MTSAAGFPRPRSVGWKLGLLGATTAAVLYTLASPPWDLSLLAWPAPALLLLPTCRLPLGRAAVAGFVFGFGIAAGITGWAFEASLRYFEFQPALAGPFVALVWALWSGVPYALLTTGYAMLVPRTPAAAHPLIAAWLWVVVELARSIPVVGMPWGLLAHTQWKTLALIQIADLGGAYAVTFVIVFVSVSVGLALQPLPPAVRRRRLAPAALLLAAALLYGFSERATTPGPGRPVAVVQGNVPNEYRWNRSFFERNLLAYLRLSPGPDAATRPDLVVWPENAVSFYLDREPMMLRPLRSFATRTRSSLIVGAPRLADAERAHNSAFLIDADGAIRDTYDKRLLVPFAEGSIWPTAAAEASDEPRYVNGGRQGLLSTHGLRLGALICFEVLFPHLSRANVLDGANVLLNISNDSWMDASGSGAAPRQHFAMSVFRAVELRRPLVRSSSGGISGFIDADGTVRSRVPWGREGFAVERVRPRDGLTSYARYGDSWVVLLSGLIAGAVLLRASRGARS